MQVTRIFQRQRKHCAEGTFVAIGVALSFGVVNTALGSDRIIIHGKIEASCVIASNSAQTLQLPRISVQQLSQVPYKIYDFDIDIVGCPNLHILPVIRPVYSQWDAQTRSIILRDFNSNMDLHVGMQLRDKKTDSILELLKNEQLPPQEGGAAHFGYAVYLFSDAGHAAVPGQFVQLLEWVLHYN